MKVLVLGIGKMGYGLLKDLAMQPDIHEIVAADVNVERAQQVVERLSGAITAQILAEKVGHIIDSMRALTGDVGGENQVRLLPEPTTLGERLILGDIKCRSGQMP